MTVRASMGRCIPLVVALTALVVGCVSTRNEAFVEIDEAAGEGDYAAAIDQLSGDADDLYPRRDRILYHLDIGMLHHYNGQHREAIQELNEAERLIEEAFTRSVTQAAATFLVNDTVQDYPGEDFEDIYLNVFKAISFIESGDTEGAFVEIRRLNTKLNLLEDKYRGLAEQYNRADEAAVRIEPGESRFFNSALARYLSMVMYRSEDDYDSARIDWQEIQEAYSAQTNIYDFEIPLGDEVLERPDDARLSVLAFAGEAPIKRAVTLWVVTFPNEVQILFAEEGQEGRLIPEGYARFAFPGIDGGFRFRFELPRLELRGSRATRARLIVDGEPQGELALFESIEAVAEDTFQVKQPVTFLKTVTRTIVRGFIAERATQELQNRAAQAGTIGVVAGVLGSIATDIAVDATERADLRGSRFFPAYAHVGEFPMATGTYDIEVEYYGSSGLVHVDRIGPVTVDADGVNLVVSHFTQ